MDQAIMRELREILGPEGLTDSRADRLCYSYDGGGRDFLPSAVAFPEKTSQVSAILRLATRGRFPVVPRGAGSGMTGGALAVAGGLVLAMSRMNRILQIDPENQIAVVEPGVITGELQRAAGAHGLCYPPDPASKDFCTIGGNVAECAGGPSAVKYGVTRDYVRGLEVVLPDGRIVVTGVRTAKGVVGYDLTRLFVGSEGTLGIVTQCTLKLVPRPEAKATFLIVTASMRRAAELVGRILMSFLPCTLEYLDRTALSLVADKLPEPLPGGAGAMLLVELDGDAAGVAKDAERLSAFLAQESGILMARRAASSPEVDRLWAARRAVSPQAFKLRPHKMSEDVVVPCSRIPDLVDFIEELNRRQAIVVFTFGHAGDGNIHVNLMHDRQNPAEAAQAEQTKRGLFEKVLELGGTLSGEHGVGITKAPFLDMELSRETIALMREIKTLLDPLNILNPGKIFPDECPDRTKVRE